MLAKRCRNLGPDLVPDALVARRGEDAELHAALRGGEGGAEHLLRLVHLDLQVEPNPDRHAQRAEVDAG